MKVLRFTLSEQDVAELREMVARAPVNNTMAETRRKVELFDMLTQYLKEFENGDGTAGPGGN